MQLQILFALLGLVLQFAAFLRLRAVAPHAPRPFAVPGGACGAWGVSACFFSCAALLLALELQGVEDWADALPLLATAAFLPCAVGAGLVWARSADARGIAAALLAGYGGGEAGEGVAEGEKVPLLGKGSRATSGKESDKSPQQ